MTRDEAKMFDRLADMNRAKRAAENAPPVPEKEAVDRVMAVLNHWFDGSRRIDRNSEMVAQLAALASPVVPVGVIKAVLEAAQNIHNTAIIYEDEALLEDAQIVLAALRQPVVPVEVRRRVLDELDKAWLHGQQRTSWRRDESADAILAALRFTDTGRE